MAGGWLGLRIETNATPQAWPMLLQVSQLYLSYEVLFYFGHRFLHLPGIYGRFHKQHHQTFGSVGISGQYASVPDFAVMTFVPVMLAAVSFDVHLSALWLFSIIGSLNSIHSHGCYEFPLFPSTKDHSLHHEKLDCNYGTGILDALLGTAYHDQPEHHDR